MSSRASPTVGGAGQLVWLPAVQMHFEKISEGENKETRLRRDQSRRDTKPQSERITSPRNTTTRPASQTCNTEDPLQETRSDSK